MYNISFCYATLIRWSTSFHSSCVQFDLRARAIQYEGAGGLNHQRHVAHTAKTSPGPTPYTNNHHECKHTIYKLTIISTVT